MTEPAVTPRVTAKAREARRSFPVSVVASCHTRTAAMKIADAIERRPT
jgi:hypothetical protein